MQVKLKYHQPAPVASFCTRGPYQLSAPLAWEKMRNFVRDRDLREQVTRAIGFYMDDPTDVAADQIRYTACIDLGANPPYDRAQNVVQDIFPGGVYASVKFEGDTSDVGKVLSRIKNEWLPKQAVSLDINRPFLEIYDTSNSMSYHGYLSAELGIPVLTGPRG